MPEHNTAEPGRLLLVKSPYPLNSGSEPVFVFTGDPTQGPIEVIDTAPGVELPPRRLIDPATEPFRLKILHLNDLHGNFRSRNNGYVQPVLSRMVWRLNQLREDYRHNPNRGVLFLSGGDDMAGSAIGCLLEEHTNPLVHHAGYQILSQAGLDAEVIGNHDLDIGSAALGNAIRQDVRFPILCANLTDAPHMAGNYYPAAMFLRNGVRIAVIGITTTAKVKQRVSDPFRIVNPLPIVHNLLPALREYCDVVILLSHLGHHLDPKTGLVEHAGDLEMAQSLPHGSLQLIVGGHTHDAINEFGLSPTNIVNGIPIVQAGTLGRFLGEVTITINSHPTVTQAVLTPTSHLLADQNFETHVVEKVLEESLDQLCQELGPVGDHPDYQTEVVQNEFAAHESALANYITDAIVEICSWERRDVDFAMIDSSTANNGLRPLAPITLEDWYNLLPYADTILVSEVTKEQLMLLLKDNAFRVDIPGEPHTERGFLHFSRGIHYRINTHPERNRNRIEINTIFGKDLTVLEDRIYRIAYPSFTRRLCAAWERLVTESDLGLLMDIHQWQVQDTSIVMRDLMVDYIIEHNGITVESGADRDGRLKITHNEQ